MTFEGCILFMEPLHSLLPPSSLLFLLQSREVKTFSILHDYNYNYVSHHSPEKQCQVVMYDLKPLKPWTKINLPSLRRFPPLICHSEGNLTSPVSSAKHGFTFSE